MAKAAIITGASHNMTDRRALKMQQRLVIASSNTERVQKAGEKLEGKAQGRGEGLKKQEYLRH